MATIATRKSTFIDAVTPARPIANKTSARKTADTAPAAQIGMVKVPAAASTSSLFLTFRVHSAPTLPWDRGRLARPFSQSGRDARGPRVAWGRFNGSELVYPSRQATAANHRWINLGRHNS